MSQIKNLRRNTRRRLAMLLFQALITYIMNAAIVGVQHIEKNKTSSECCATHTVILFISYLRIEVYPTRRDNLVFPLRRDSQIFKIHRANKRLLEWPDAPLCSNKRSGTSGVKYVALTIQPTERMQCFHINPVVIIIQNKKTSSTLVKNVFVLIVTMTPPSTRHEQFLFEIVTCVLYAKTLS